MDSRVLIDAIVRQTTVLIARLSTVEGARSPLGHIANEIFTGLTTELVNQGVSTKVIADMFGMALRTYRLKVQRLGESVTSRGVTLWSAVQSYLAARESTTRTELLERFRYDDETSVRGILNDLVESGFVIRSGRGEDTRYRMATEEELRDVGAAIEGNAKESLAVLVWVHVYREGPLTLERLCQLVPHPRAAIEDALTRLTQDSRIRRESRFDGEVYIAQEVIIPFGEAAGWEAAVVDHHRVVLNAIAAKITSGSLVSARSDEVGGSTMTYDLWPGHPKEAEVRRLLATTRAAIVALWDEVADHNRAHPEQLQRPHKYHVHFYCGQYLMSEEQDP